MWFKIKYSSKRERTHFQFERIPLEWLQQNMMDYYYQHSIDSTCTNPPEFKVENKFGQDFLTIQCHSCGFFRIIS
jgi:hypothetical protein